MKISKKKLGISLLLVFLFLFSGCVGNDTKSKQLDKSIAQQEKINSNVPAAAKLDNDPLTIVKKNIDLTNLFHGINGCAILYNLEQNQYLVYNEAMCDRRTSPYSTFKIVSTLMGLENGILKDESSTMKYSGDTYPIEQWNGNLTLQQAFQSSCVWYFRQVIDAVGQDKVKKKLNELVFGNCDISQWNGSSINPGKDLNGFWLDSSLKISPAEQIRVLYNLFEGKSNFTDQNVSVLKKIMLIEKNETQAVYGKTGTGVNGEAWFIGFIEQNGHTQYFSVYLNDENQKNTISGNVAKEIALNMLNL